MENNAPRWTLRELANLLGGECRGPEALPLARPVAAGDDDPLGVTFAESDKYLALAENSEVGAVIVGPETESRKPSIVVSSPRLAFGKLLAMSARELPIAAGIHHLASVSSEARVDPSAFVGPYAVIEQGAEIGPGARIYPFCYVGADCLVGERAVLYPGAVLYRDVRVGARSVIHSGAVIGADGFGFVWDGSKRLKVPQVGSVRIGDDVEVGANTCIDRATAGETVIEDGVKLDNIVQIGHNVRVGEHSAIAGMSGISGSTKIGKRVLMGGGVGTRDHVTIGDDVALGGRSNVGGDITEPGEYLGTPAAPAREAVRAMLTIHKLPELVSRIRQLEKRLAELEKSKE
jgi:UDP-3-O-[3-hydroxymyristoyl] glucosamine N-acyltransferase